MTITVKSRKAKGARFQQMVRDEIINLLKPFGVEPADVKSTSMGANGEDVTLSPFARGYLPISIECKSHKSMAVYNWWEQTKSNAGSYAPVLFLKANNKEPLVVMDMKEWTALQEAAILWDLYGENPDRE